MSDIIRYQYFRIQFSHENSIYSQHGKIPEVLSARLHRNPSHWDVGICKEPEKWKWSRDGDIHTFARIYIYTHIYIIHVYVIHVYESSIKLK